MMDTNGDIRDDAYSVIGEKGEIKFIDYEDDKSVCSYNPADEGPVIISIPFPFQKKKPQSVLVGEAAVDSITIENTTEESVELWKVKIYASNPENSFTLSLMEPPSENSDNEYIESFVESYEIEDRTLQPHSSLTVWLTCKTKEIGLCTSAVHFTVGDDVIERVVFLLVDDKISQSLASSKPYSRTMKKKKSFPVDNFVPGIRANRSRPRGRRYYYHLPQYCISQDVRETIENKQIPGPVLEGLSLLNYASYFTNLLVMEELKLEEDMRAYDMECVSMRRRGAEYLTLEVPGLAERRPSLVHGDFIFSKLASEDASDSSPPYQGYIHRVEADEVYLKFERDFHMRHIDANLYNVHFKYNRLNIRRQYHAINAAGKLGKELLFPSECSKRRLVSTVPLVPISCTLNEEQIYAVEKILGCKGGPPYVIHGPPGTGKTMTIVEAILQLYKRRRSARILVCAASNSAADHVLEKILGNKAVSVQENEVFRLNAATRPYEDVNSDHIRFCFFEDFIFKCLPHEVLMNVRIIISTYMSTSQLYAEGLQKGNFSHVFLDEAGQASEPETMVPISHLYEKDTVVVLAGDPMQLGPVVFSKDADMHGLGKSYLERLFQCNFYCDGNEDYVTKLVRNYRCHRNILYLPSKLFYDGELIACKDETVSSICWGSLLPNQDFPVLFIGVQGCDEREGNNPSWFNRIEVSKVVDVIKKLTESGKLNEEDIGVITPYRQQVSKLKNALGSLNMCNIKVGSVEQFQGQEREVIIISTVRSTIKHNEFDRTYCLGFLSNPRRFNVAVTRARSLLIIIGNPHIICKDPFWNRLLWHCADNESYQGCALPERKDFDDEKLTNEDIWQSAGENYQPIQNSGWGPCSSQDWNAEPSKDDTEWSGGWAEECGTNEMKISSASAPEEAATSQSRWGDEHQRGATIPWWNEEPVTDVDKWSEEGWKC